jgi:hypothetical protein
VEAKGSPNDAPGLGQSPNKVAGISYENRIASSFFGYLTCWQQHALWLNE